MSVSRKALRKAVAKMSNGKEKQKKEENQELEKILRAISYQQKVSHKKQQ